MPVITPTPSDIKESKIYKVLMSKSTPENGAEEKAYRLIQAAAPFLDLIIGGPFKEYTLHDQNHSKKLLHLIDYLVTDKILENLSALECLLIIYSVYLHDMGMSLTSVERTRILASDEFTDTLQDWTEVWDSLQSARKQLIEKEIDAKERLLIEAEIFQLQEVALCAYLRPRHATAERYQYYINEVKKSTGRADLFEYSGVSFEDFLVQICVSHNESVDALAEVRGAHNERFPTDFLLAGTRINAQFCAALLRLADILDFDRERTPKILFESLGIASRTLPGAEVTLKEWTKHMSVHSIEITQNEIIITADCKHPVIEKTIRDFCLDIEREIRNTQAVLKHNPYNIELPISVRPRIRSIDYVYKDISLRVNEAAIITLLMGERLYSNQAVAIRELIQNAIDACSVRQKISHASYKAKIQVNLLKDENKRFWIEVEDNGIGMDEYVIAEYFLQLGNSYYNSPELQRLMGHDFTPISRFGIGIVSIFMIGDVLEVNTRRFHSPRKDDVSRIIRIERMGGLAFIRESTFLEFGTKIRFRLKQEIEKEIEVFKIGISDYLQKTVIKPKYDIDLNLDGKVSKLSSKSFVLNQKLKEFLKQQDNIEVISLELSRWSNILSGSVILVFSINEKKQLAHTRDGRKLSYYVDPHDLVYSYEGNRLSVNGFRMSATKISKLFIGNKFTMFYDIDFKGNKEITYDVSRDKIIGKGTIQKLFSEALLAGLQETGVMDKFSTSTKGVLETYTRYKIVFDRTPIEDEELLKKVLTLLPKNERWEKNIHKNIAKQLGVSNNTVFRAIHTLVKRGII